MARTRMYKFELFSNCERFVTFTGMSPDGTCWGDIDGTFGGLLALLEKKVANGHDVEIVTSIDVETPCGRCRRAHQRRDGRRRKGPEPRPQIHVRDPRAEAAGSRF